MSAQKMGQVFSERIQLSDVVESATSRRMSRN